MKSKRWLALGLSAAAIFFTTACGTTHNQAGDNDAGEKETAVASGIAETGSGAGEAAGFGEKDPESYVADLKFMVHSDGQPVLYGGILSCGVAYTLQVIGQKYTTPGEASIIMSMESPFALLGGMLLLEQIPQCREWIGIGLMFVAIIASQIKNDSIGDTR